MTSKMIQTSHSYSGDLGEYALSRANALAIPASLPFVQNGNAFGAPAFLGTTDAFPLEIITGGTPRAAFSGSSPLLAFAAGSTITGTALTITGGVGSLSLDTATALNLGAGSATSVTIGNTNTNTVVSVLTDQPVGYGVTIRNSAGLTTANGVSIRAGDIATGGATLLGLLRGDGALVGSLIQLGTTGILLDSPAVVGIGTTSSTGIFIGNAGITTQVTGPLNQVSGSASFISTGTGFTFGIGSLGNDNRFALVCTTPAAFAGTFSNFGNAPTAGGITILAGANGAPGAEFLQFLRPDSTVCGSVTQSGGSFNNVSYNTASDARLKEAIIDWTHGLDLLKQIRVREYAWKNDLRAVKGRDVGFLAQELIELFPNAVSRGDDAKPWMVDYGRITPLLVSALQRLLARVEHLEASR